MMWRDSGLKICIGALWVSRVHLGDLLFPEYDWYYRVDAFTTDGPATIHLHTSDKGDVKARIA